MRLDGVNATAQTSEGFKFDNTTGDLSKIYTGTVGAVAVAAPAPGQERIINQPGQIYQTGTMI